MNEERLSRKSLQWCPSGRRRKGRSRNSWMQEVTTVMRGNVIDHLKCIDREEWRRKIKF
jgi:hypothetical protein